MKLRDYQQPVVNTIRSEWAHTRSVLAVMPTGGGKTVVFTSIMHDHVGAAAAVVHRKEIVSQISCTLASLGVVHRVIAPPKAVTMIRRKHLAKFKRSFIDPHANKGVISVQTVTSKASQRDAKLSAWLDQVTLCVFDEGHHYVKRGVWARAVERVGRAKLLFVTATPERADGLGLGSDANGFCDVMVQGPSTRWLITNGYLSRYVYKAPKTDLNMDNIPRDSTGDVNAKALRARTVESHLVGDTVQQYLEFASGKKAIVFASDCQTSEELAAEFNRVGVRAAALDGGTDQLIRDRTMEQFEAGGLDVVVNVDLFDEGLDIPGVECVITARVTFSLQKYLQMVGRALRPVYAPGMPIDTPEQRLAAMNAGSKPRAIIIDPVRNWERNGGLPDWPRAWGLNGRAMQERGGPADTLPLRPCVACTQPYGRALSACPYCGEPAPEPAGRSTPEQVDGALMDLDVEAWGALMERIRRADMTDGEYAADQIARGIPPIGRGADMKRFRAAKTRRGVLHELVAWWVGAQPGRDLREIHRRFYLRFGVDIGTAFTLSADDTDKLIKTIRDGFVLDLEE